VLEAETDAGTSARATLANQKGGGGRPFGSLPPVGRSGQAPPHT